MKIFVIDLNTKLAAVHYNGENHLFRIHTDVTPF